MRTKINILNTTTIINNHNLKKNPKHIYTATRINNASNNLLIKKKHTNSTTKTKKKNNKEK